ncbi:Mur ligase domain-containing protein [Isoptericola jiangsuensis]|uniref:Mur ligase domain-containing protein n=1 Tax=Isoptericola jiangsuensis TaxID=548579 RepID=UPI003AABE698
MTPGDGPGPGLAELGRVHLVGVGGAGVSVVARLLAAAGVPVQGSDAAGGPALDALRADGVTVWVGHDAAHVVGPDGVPVVDTLVVSSAVRESNPELAAARGAGLRVLHRSQALARLMDGRRSVAVAGAHGKTTTSAMTATVLAACGIDPSYAIGGTSCCATATSCGPRPAAGPGPRTCWSRRPTSPTGRSSTTRRRSPW